MLMYKANGCLFPEFKQFRCIHFILFLILAIAFQDCKQNSPDDYYFMPAEFEEQEAVWLGCQGFSGFNETRAELVRALSPYVQIKIVSNSDSTLEQCKKNFVDSHININSIEFTIIKDNEFWMRDHGATFVISRGGKMKAVDFEWTNYGYEEWLQEYYSGDKVLIKQVMESLPKTQKGKIDSVMGAMLKIPILKSWLRVEGGMIETNGNGTIILNEPLTLSRNYSFTKDSISKEFKRVLGAKNIIWLKEGLAEDPHVCQTIVADYISIGTGGHTDEYVRFANENTILLAWVPEEEKEINPINEINYKRMNINYAILKNAKDLDGKNFNIIKVPLPDLVVERIKINPEDEWEASLNIPEFMFKPQDGWKQGDTVRRIATASYLNFFISNNIVLMPTYLKAGTSLKKENEVKSIFAKVFPNRKIELINALSLNWRGGGIHCAIMPQPKKQMLP